MINLNAPKKFTYTLKAVNKKSDNLSDLDKKFVFEMKKPFISGDFYKNMRDLFVKQDFNINIDLNSFLELIDKKDYIGLINAIFSSHESTYHLPCSFKTTPPTKVHHNFMVDMKKYGSYINEALTFISAESFTRKLEGLPANMLSPSKFVDLVKQEFAKFSNVEIKVLDKKELTKKQMNLILAVGQASNQTNEPKLLSISLKGKSSGKKLVLVGKGVCFDTGGLNLKPSQYLEGMQYDMSGAAIVVGTMMALASSKTNANVTILAPLVVNDIGQDGLKVSDVITSYSKQTVEITNTDAEGRLILADAITYAEKDLKADTILTIATLTGAVEICFSDTFTPFWFTKRDQFIQVQNAAINAGELVWEMPLHFEYDARMKSSKIADMVNSEKTRGAGSSTAACFLSFFRKKANFIHVDIASTNEFKHSPLPIMVKTLYYFAKNFK